jgi:RimJ/RimL family protein N-acetyltransferase
MRTPHLTDGAVVLDGFRLADVPVHLAGGDDEFARRFGWNPGDSTAESVQAAIRRWQRGWQREGRLRAWAVRTAGGLVGGCELRLREDEIADLSYWTLAGHRRRGYATRAVRLACRHAFTEMGLERIELSIEPDNAASLAVARAAGFTEEGTLRRCVVLRGKRYDVVLFSRLVTDEPGTVPVRST